MNKCFSCVALLAVCLATVGCHAQTALHTLDFSVSAKNFVDTIPIEWENNQVYVPVEMGIANYQYCTSDKFLYLVENAPHAISYLVDEDGYYKNLITFCKLEQ